MIKTLNGEYGFVKINENNEVVYAVAEPTMQGMIYKSTDVFNNYPDLPCYIPEFGFDDEEIGYDASTHNSIIEDVKSALSRYTREEQKTLLSELSIEEWAEHAFNAVDWQHIIAYLEETLSEELSYMQEEL